MDNHPLAETTNTPSTIVYENGTLLGTSSDNETCARNNLIIPEIVISPSYSSQSINHTQTRETEPEEHTALLENQRSDIIVANDDFEHFVLQRNNSENNILESSIYSESNQTQQAAPQTVPTTVIELLNSSNCSRESRQAKRTRRKHKSKSKCSVSSTSGTRSTGNSNIGGAPPQYTAIFLDPHATQTPTVTNTTNPTQYLNGTDVNSYYQYYHQQRPLLTTTVGHHHHHHHR